VDTRKRSEGAPEALLERAVLLRVEAIARFSWCLWAHGMISECLGQSNFPESHRIVPDIVTALAVA